MVKIKTNGCGCSFLYMYKWLPNFCFTNACNIHDVEITQSFFKSSFNFRKNMMKAIKNQNHKPKLYIIANLYFMGVFCFGCIFHLFHKFKNNNRGKNVKTKI
jgi:hypothetical protein